MKHTDTGVLVAAPTGVAALIAEGQTLHSKPGPGVPKGTTEAFGNMKSKSSAEMWWRVRCLVVDEISMVDAEFLDWYMASVPNNLQIIFCGDCEQLPPVPDKQGSLNNEEHLRNCVAAARRKDNNELRDVAGRKDPAIDEVGKQNGGWLDMSKNTPFGLKETTGKFAFQSVAWREANLHVHHLTKVHRTNEPMLLDALTDLRAGMPGTPAIEALRQETNRPLPPKDGVEATTLYPKKRNVQVENSRQLEMLDRSTAQVYRANDQVEIHLEAPPWVTKEELLQNSFFKEDCQAAKEFELRIGAQVMLLRNEVDSQDGEMMRGGNGRRLVNGSRGVVIGFDYACALRSDAKLDGMGQGSQQALYGSQAYGSQASSSQQPRGGTQQSSQQPRGGTQQGGGGVGSWDDQEPDPRAGDDYHDLPPPMPTGPPPEGALISPLWEPLPRRSPDGQPGWRHMNTGEISYERPPPLLYPIVRFVGKGTAPGRVKLIRPERFERHMYLKGTLIREQCRSLSRGRSPFTSAGRDDRLPMRRLGRLLCGGPSLCRHLTRVLS